MLYSGLLNQRQNMDRGVILEINCKPSQHTNSFVISILLKYAASFGILIEKWGVLAGVLG
jgi:hypothetical protein